MFMKLLFHPAVDFLWISEDAGLRRSAEPMYGEAEHTLPVAAGFFGSPEVDGDLLPGLEDPPILHAPPGAIQTVC